MDHSASSSSPFAAGERTPLPGGARASSVTLLAGSRFYVCDASGDVSPGGVHGFYAQDTRLLSRWELLLDGSKPQVVSSRLVHDEDVLESIAFCGDPTGASLVVARTISLRGPLSQEIQILNLRGEAVEVSAELRSGADFADLFEVKRGDEARGGFVGFGPEIDSLLMTYVGSGFFRTVSITPSADHPFELLRDGVKWTIPLQPHGEEIVSVQVAVEITEHGRPRSSLRIDHEAPAGWAGERPRLASTDSRLATAWNRSVADVAALRLWDDTADEHAAYPALAAGVPWFMTLFGRDSLISGMFALPLGTDLLVGALTALARRQGTRFDERTCEAPGKILHEVRAGAAVQQPVGWGERYYGSVDATPLFVMALGAAWRWGADPSLVTSLMPAAERAIGWILGPGDVDGDGFVEYEGAGPASGLVNQGWKDSHDGLRFADGSLPEGPIALVEAQGYCVAAFRAMAELRAAFGPDDPDSMLAHADEMIRRIDEHFWQPGLGCHAVALDGAKNPVDSVTTNPAHLLWCGAVPDERGHALAERLTQADMATGFGLRTLAAGNPGYNPMSYHCGSVWPHDTAIAIGGMCEYGQHERAEPLMSGLLEAAAAFGGRLPELFGGFDRSRFDPPVPYPTSCSPQAWAACVPFLLVSALLGLEPDAASCTLRLRPRLPEELEIEVTGIPVGGGKLSVTAQGSDCEVLEAPAGYDVRLC